MIPGSSQKAQFERPKKVDMHWPANAPSKLPEPLYSTGVNALSTPFTRANVVISLFFGEGGANCSHFQETLDLDWSNKEGRRIDGKEVSAICTDFVKAICPDVLTSSHSPALGWPQCICQMGCLIGLGR